VNLWQERHLFDEFGAFGRVGTLVQQDTKRQLCQLQLALIASSFILQ
jgi:hypothetical protein